MTFRAPVDDLLFVMTHGAGLGQGLENGVYHDLEDGMAATLLAEAGKFAESVIAPINRAGDTQGATLANGVVTTAPGWVEAYGHWREGGWNGVCAPIEHGGMGLPHLLQAACLDMWNGANMAFTLAPLLTFGAIDALVAHGSPELQERWLSKLVSGEWTATMNLTEPQAGSDLAALRSRAERAADGTYRVFGQKIYITYGEHDMTDNIVHLVLARLPDAPAGTRGISLFLVPKFLPGADGSPGARNDLRCTGLEHKMGIHGSPTASMSFGDNEGAVGWLIGEENKGLACMFTMMNAARLAVGLQGVGIGERAFQQALAFAMERRQGKSVRHTGAGMSPIAHHPDVRRMLMTMKALTQAARVICYMTANAIDLSHRLIDPQARQAASERAGLLTPVAKAFATDIGSEVASLGVQIHGGMGYIEETGAAQHLRDAHIAAIYEGTNGIQAMDLVTRKLGLSGGAAMGREVADMRLVIAQAQAAGERFSDMAARLAQALDALERAATFLGSASSQAVLAGATPFLRLFALARGGTGLAALALAAQREDPSDPAGRITLAQFFAQNIASGAGALETSIVQGHESVLESDAALGISL